ncbi:MAG: S1C family serine protease [Pyrinomonadaceae bacterium]
MYKLSARQILLLTMLSALFAAGTVFFIDRYGTRFQPRGAAFSESAPAGITNPSMASDEQNNIEVYKAISPGVAFITSTAYSQDIFNPGERQGAGSGSVIDEQGDILTNDHVVAGAQKLTVSFGMSKTYPATVIGRDPDTDLAVIRVNAPRDQLTVVPLGDSERIVVGQKVLAIGNPFGLDRTLTTGVISGLQRPIYAPRTERVINAMQTDASINPGNSGGPLLDSSGRMIGINSQILSPSGEGSVGVGFAIPVNVAKRIVPQLIRSGVVRRPVLGGSFYNIKNIDRNQVRLPVSDGAMVYQVDPGGGAAAAGLRGLTETEDGDVLLGDIITAIDREKVSTSDDIYRLLDKHQVGDTVRVEVVRGNNRTTVPVRLSEAATGRRGNLRR